MPDTPTASPAVQKLNQEIDRLQRARQKIIAQIPESDNPLMKGLIAILNKKLDKIEEEIRQAQKELEEKIKASDLVTPEVFEKIKDGTEDLIDGNTDEALEDFKKAGEGAIKAGADKIIEEHIKDEKIAALIKEVVEDVVEGDFEGLLEVVADGIVEIAKDKLAEFIEHLLELLKKEVTLKVELRLKAEVKDLINNSITKTAKKFGSSWTAKLAVTVAKNLLKRSVGIIKEEIEHLATRKTFEILLDVLKDAALQTLQSGLKGRKIKDILKELLEHAVNHPQFQQLIQESKERMLRKFLDMAFKEARYVTNQILDAYLRVNGTWNGPMLNIAKRSTKIGPWWGCVNVALSASASLYSSMSATRKGTGAEVKGKAWGSAYAGVGISIGYDLPIVGDISIEGGIKGGPKLSTYFTVAMEVKGSTIQGDLKPLTIDLDIVAFLYFDTPLPNSILKYVPAYLEEVTVSGSTLEYPLGKLNVLQIKTPEYQVVFDSKVQKYAYHKKGGGFDVDLNPKIKAYIQSVKDSVNQAANDAWDAINPANIDLNPFDEEGWIGSLFN